MKRLLVLFSIVALIAAGSAYAAVQIIQVTGLDAPGSYYQSRVIVNSGNAKLNCVVFVAHESRGQGSSLSCDWDRLQQLPFQYQPPPVFP